MSAALCSGSYGGGRQSTAMLVLAKRGVIDFPVFLFANVGDDSESPETLAYVREVAMPYGAKHGIEVIELRMEGRAGTPVTLRSRLTKRKSMMIPVRQSGGVPASRSCTAEFKARVMAKWRVAHGASEENPAITAIGFSVDEAYRVNKRKASLRPGARKGEKRPIEQLVYPLLTIDREQVGIGSGVGMNLTDCVALIEDEGLPLPPKSACWFCPWHSSLHWRRMRSENPEQFAEACAIEAMLSERSQARGAGPVFMHDALVPLPALTGGEGVEYLSLDFDGVQVCDEGGCWT